MQRIRRVFCAALAGRLAAVTLLPAGAFADAAVVPIDEAHFPDEAFRAWLTDPANLDGAGADGAFHTGNWAAVPMDWLINIPRNFIMALPLQFILAGPVVRKLFRTAFPEGTVLA